jgi:hypothetical protein
MTKKSKAKAKEVRPERSKIIEQAVIYAQALAAYHAGFEVDPTGDSDYASKQLGIKSARKALEKLNSISPRKGPDKYESCLSADGRAERNRKGVYSSVRGRSAGLHRRAQGGDVMSIVKFPGETSTPEGYDDEGNLRHAEHFRCLHTRIDDCASMSLFATAEMEKRRKSTAGLRRLPFGRNDS